MIKIEFKNYLYDYNRDIMKVLVFDTETTGLPEGRNTSITEVEKWPHIIQISYLLYDTERVNMLLCEDHIIKLDESVYISEESVRIHGITRSQSTRKGVPLIEAIRKFNSVLQIADCVVGHNLSFDKRMIMVECRRLKISHHFTNQNGSGVKEYCTMKNSITLCAIEVVSKNGNSYYKYPKLQELHHKLFGNIPNGTHDSLGDVLICLRCYGIMVHNHDISKKGDAKMKNLYKLYCE